MSYLEVQDGAELYFEYRASDSGDGPTVVFLNGMTQSTVHWKQHVEALAGRYGVLTYDARGQGRSRLGDAQLSMDRHASDLAAVFEQVGVEKAHLIGFSYGARLALGFARSRPSRVGRLVLCGQAVEPNALARVIVRSWKEVLETGGIEALAWTSLTHILGKDFLEGHEAILDGIVKATVERNDTESVKTLLEALDTYPDPGELARDVSVPAKVIYGSEDLLVHERGATRLAEILEGEVAEISGVGHTVPIEAPEKFRRQVVSFLESD